MGTGRLGAFLNIPMPLIAAVHGFCLGSGVEMALLCDIRIASQDSVFGMPEVALGMVPAAGGTQTLPRILGIARALDLLLTRRRLSAKEALEAGLVNMVVRAEDLDSEVDAMAGRLLHMDRGVVRAAKQAVLRGAELPLNEGLALEARLALMTMGKGKTY